MQQRRRSRAQIQHEGGSRVFYFKHAGGAKVLSVPYAPLLRTRWLEGPVWTPSPPLRPTWAKPPPLPLGVPTPPPAKMKERPASEEITLQPLIRGRRPWIGLEEDVETILGFSALLQEVRQLR